MCSPWSKPNFPILALLALVLAGCATSPPSEAPGAAAAWLGGQPRVVVRLDTTKISAWTDVIRSRDALKAVGDRTHTAWLGFELNNLDDLATAADTVSIVLEGDFPKAAASFMLNWNSSWKHEVEGVWTSDALQLAVRIPADNIVAVRRQGGPAEASTGVLRDLDPAELEKATAWISFWSPGEALFGATGAKLLPVTRLDAVLTANGDVLEGPLILHFADERSAQVAVVLMKLLTPQIKARLGQELEWVARDNLVIGTTLRVQQSDLKALAEKLVTEAVEEP